MHILVTGADQPLGEALARHLAPRHEVRRTGRPRGGEEAASKEDYLLADLRTPGSASALVSGVQAVVHTEAFDDSAAEGPEGEAALLERATLGTYRLCQAARDAKVGRIIVAASLRVYDTVPERFLIDEMWRPRPEPDATLLAPYLCEQAVREFAREGGLCGVALRFMPLGDDPERHTRLGDALRAVDCALAMPFEPRGYRWHVFHVASSSRFLLRDAEIYMGFQPGKDRPCPA
jgi:nucleoside-diphosphate-sugar epimerase